MSPKAPTPDKKRSRAPSDAPPRKAVLAVAWPTTPEEWGQWLWTHRAAAEYVLKALRSNFEKSDGLLTAIADHLLEEQQQQDPPEYPRVSHVMQTADGMILVDHWDDDRSYRRDTQMWSYGYDMLMSAREHEEKMRQERRAQYIKSNPPPAIDSKEWPEVVRAFMKADPTGAAAHSALAWCLKAADQAMANKLPLWSELLQALSPGTSKNKDLPAQIQTLCDAFGKKKNAYASALKTAIVQANPGWIKAIHQSITLSHEPLHEILGLASSLSPIDPPISVARLVHKDQVALWSAAWSLSSTTNPGIDQRASQQVCSLVMGCANTPVGVDLFKAWWQQQVSNKSPTGGDHFPDYALAAARHGALNALEVMFKHSVVSSDTHTDLVVQLTREQKKAASAGDGNTCFTTALTLWCEEVPPNILEETWFQLIKSDQWSVIDAMSHHVPKEHVILLTRRALSASLSERAPLVHALLQQQDLRDALPQDEQSDMESSSSPPPKRKRM